MSFTTVSVLSTIVKTSQIVNMWEKQKENLRTDWQSIETTQNVMWLQSHLVAILQKEDTMSQTWKVWFLNKLEAEIHLF